MEGLAVSSLIAPSRVWCRPQAGRAVEGPGFRRGVEIGSCTGRDQACAYLRAEDQVTGPRTRKIRLRSNGRNHGRMTFTLRQRTRAAEGPWEVTPRLRCGPGARVREGCYPVKSRWCTNAAGTHTFVRRVAGGCLLLPPDSSTPGPTVGVDRLVWSSLDLRRLGAKRDASAFLLLASTGCGGAPARRIRSDQLCRRAPRADAPGASGTGSPPTCCWPGPSASRKATGKHGRWGHHFGSAEADEGRPFSFACRCSQ